MAYASRRGAYFDGVTLYVAGVRHVSDLFDGFLATVNKPTWTDRYMAAIAELGGGTPQFVVGHSLGGSVASAIAEYYHVPSASFGAPSGPTYSHFNDPVAALNTKAIRVPGSGHSLRSYTRRPPGYRPKPEEL